MGMKFNKGGTSKTPGAIKGYCTIVASPSNPIAGSCVSIMLILKEADGTEAEKNRTSPQGQFSFLGQAGKTYTIESGSKFYESVKAKNLIYPGDTVNVFLKQK